MNANFGCLLVAGVRKGLAVRSHHNMSNVHIRPSFRSGWEAAQCRRIVSSADADPGIRSSDAQDQYLACLCRLFDGHPLLAAKASLWTGPIRRA
jgi:hypothetical protein